MADSKHTITIKSEDSGKGRGSEDKLNPADFMKLFQQEVAKIKDAILKDNPDMPRGEAQRQAQKEASEQLQNSRRRNEGTVAPSSTDDGDDLKLAPPVDINPRTILPEDPIGFEEDSDEDIVKSQNVLRGMSSGKSDPTKPLSLEADEGNFDDSNDQFTRVGIGGNKEEEEDFYENLLDKEDRNASIRSTFGVDNDEGNFDDSDDQLQDDVEESSEDSDTDDADAAKQLVKASSEEEEEDEDGGFFQRQGKKLGGAAAGVAGGGIGATIGAIGGGIVGGPAGARAGASAGYSMGSAALKPIGQAVGQTAGAVADASTQFAGEAMASSTGDSDAAASATLGAVATAGEGTLKAFGSLAGMIPGVGGILETAFNSLGEAIGPVAEGLVQFLSSITAASEEVMAFNPQILGERIETDLDMLFKKMDRAQKTGDEFAEFESSRGDMMSVFEDIKTGLFKMLVPIGTLVTKMIKAILDMFLEWLPTIGEFIAALLEGLAWIVDWFDGSGVSAAQQAIIDTADSVRKAAKEVEQWHDEEKEKEEKNYMGEIDQWLTGGFLESDHIGAVGPAPPGVL